MHSLLPVPFHPQVAKLCVKHRKHMITASYTSPAMRELDSSARNAGVLLLNEIGLDPGLDHCSATSLLEQLKQDGKKVKSFTSFCGGLPAPDALEGDGSGLGYKFSWSPFGVLSATLNEARFKLMGQVYCTPHICTSVLMNDIRNATSRTSWKDTFPVCRWKAMAVCCDSRAWQIGIVYPMRRRMV